MASGNMTNNNSTLSNSTISYSIPEKTTAFSFAVDIGLLVFSFVVWLRNRTAGHKLLLFDILIGLVAIEAISNSLTIASLICIDLNIDANALFYLTNFAILISTVTFYAAQAVISKGLSITRTALEPIERQVVLIIGLSMAIVEVLMNTTHQAFSVSLIFIYIFILRILLLQVDRNMYHLEMQLQRLQVRPTNEFPAH
eukprot:jgi/Hompol1/1963/HPOL_005799-RA